MEAHIAPAKSLMCWMRDGAVKLRLEATGPASDKPILVHDLLKEAAEKSPDAIALGQKVNGEWQTYNYKQYYSIVKQVARAFIKLGLEPFNGVGIIGFNSPEWFFADLAAVFAGGLATGIYTTNSPDACHYVADNARCNIIVVENDQQLQKILQIRAKLSHLKAIIQYTGQPKEKYPDVYSWSEMLQLGAEEDVLNELLEKRLAAQAANKCCTLIYTSGTTGNPKGVMLSHDNLTWSARQLCKVAHAEFAAEVGISYLPLSHVAAQIVDLYGPIACSASVYFAQPDALKGSLGKTLKEVRPTTFLGVPRVWEKMHEAMVAIGKNNGFVKRSIASWARGVGLYNNLAAMNGASRSFTFSIADMLVFSKVKAALGLDRCKMCCSGAAPMNKDTLDFFLSLDLPVMEVYGMSESTGMQAMETPWKYRMGSCGCDFLGVKTIIDEPDKEGNGEILMEGRHVFMGYLNMEDQTRATIDEKGRLHSGDVGRKDEDGFLHITGRIKELLITAGGENVPPVPIEDRLKVELPAISNCMLIGDKRKFLSMLITIRSEINADTQEPTNRLSPVALQWARSLGSDAVLVSDVQRDVALLKSVQAAVDRVNKAATSRAQCVQKWCILPRDFSEHGGELGPTLKLKRSVVEKMYHNTIDEFYSETPND